eukprot:TRINITY_DN35919_c0_g1_i1.p1 TRINITY_DN35919_c0_g1~~TRINITY_DN35919_c0_g1_i1.p1  ORF type:complete len:411 (+),score=144.90 TRINITY_DN35919_c0_g1_i1:109-1233(+)
MACTWVTVKAPAQNVHVIGRTMETGGKSGEMFLRRSRTAQSLSQDPLPFRVVVHPRGEEMALGTGHCGPKVPPNKWMKWTNQYGFVGIDQPDLNGPVLVEGMNEHGLTVSMHTLRQAVYQKPVEGKGSMCYIDLPSYLMATCKTVEEAVAALQGITVEDPLWAVSASGTRGHWGIADGLGKQVVVEYLNGELHVHNNTIGIMTNDPDYEWQLRNLNNFVNLQPSWPTAPHGMQIDTEIGAVPSAIGHGFNLVGLPGDVSPPARFVNMFYLRELAQQNLPVRNESEAITLVTALLNRVIVVQGSVARAQKDDPAFDFTQYAVMKIPETRKFIYRGYFNMQWKQVDLAKVDFTKSSAMPLYDGTSGIIDVTSDLQP